MPHPTLVSIQMDIIHLEELLEQRYKLHEHHGTVPPLELAKNDIRIARQRQRISEMKKRHHQLYCGRLPRLTALAELDKTFRDVVIETHLEMERSALAFEEDLEDAYRASLTRKTLRRAEMIAQAFAEVDAEDLTAAVGRHIEEEESDELESVAAQYIAHKDLMARLHPERVTVGHSMSAEDVKDIEAFMACSSRTCADGPSAH
jgi:hypothetical protein